MGGCRPIPSTSFSKYLWYYHFYRRCHQYNSTMEKIVNTYNTCVLYLREEARKNVFMGERGPMPPPILHDYFQPTRKGGGGLSPPKFLVTQQKLIANAPENAGNCRITPQNAAKRCKKQKNATKRHKTPQNSIIEDR